MKENIREILWNFVAGEVTDSEAVQQVLDLFAVVGQSEQVQPDEDANRCKRCNCYGCVCDVVDGI
jgi:hypothetical protein